MIDWHRISDKPSMWLFDTKNRWGQTKFLILYDNGDISTWYMDNPDGFRIGPSRDDFDGRSVTHWAPHGGFNVPTVPEPYVEPNFSYASIQSYKIYCPLCKTLHIIEKYGILTSECGNCANVYDIDWSETKND